MQVFLQLQSLTAVLFVELKVVPFPSLIRAAIFGIVIEVGEALLELGPDGTLLQVGHGQLVLLFNKGLRHNKKVE